MRGIAECTIHTLLPLLQHHYPDYIIEGNFTSETVGCCKNMKYDEATGHIIDPSMEQSMVFMEETLPGFELDLIQMGSNEQTSSRPLHTGFSSGNDSVSTLGRPQGQQLSTSTSTRLVSILGSSSHQNDDASVLSSTSGITMATIHTIETQI